MCTLLVWKNRHPAFPVIVAANRDEFEGRLATGPQRLHDRPLVVGGRDEVAGGTWLAVSERGIVVALTNRRGVGRHDPTKRSRGKLVAELARCASIDDIETALRATDSDAFNPFVLVALDARDGIAAQSGAGAIEILPIADGVHAVTNWEFDSRAHPKAQRALALAADFDPDAETAEALAPRLHELLKDHAPGERGMDGGLCVHRPDAYGTRSSAIVLLGSDPAKTRFYFGPGHPCENRMQDVTPLLAAEVASRTPVEGTR